MTDIKTLNSTLNSNAYQEAAQTSKSWPFEEARKICTRIARTGQKSVLFETGFGASGLPHIGTFGEVARTIMVKHAFELLAPEIATKLICFSDDMDGLRKVPDNLPNQDMLAAHLEKPLTDIPDPFDTHASFGAHNNARLRDFLDRFEFDYEFASATDYYRTGKFDDTLMKMLAHYEDIIAIILPTLGEERQQTYSPFLPICPDTGRVLMVPMQSHNPDAGTVTYIHPARQEAIETPVTGGACKMQWKADWAMRWLALNVDYEMAGKDLSESVTLSGKIVEKLGGTRPEGLSYELFLDEQGQKISKSKGNGLTIDEWLHYAPPQSLALYMFQAPRKAKRLYFDVIPKAVDEYITFLDKYQSQEETEQLANPAYHIHNGQPPPASASVSFALLLNLVSASNAESKDALWGYIQSYAPHANPQSEPFLDELTAYALAYYTDFVKPHKRYRLPDTKEKTAIYALIETLKTLPANSDAQTIQNHIYEIGKTHFAENLRDWFKALYEILLGQSQGPRFGSFVALYGLADSIKLMERALAEELV